MRAALRVAVKDLRVEGRARELLASGLLTSLLAVAVGALALGGVADDAAVAAGILWLALVFGASLVLARSVTAEVDRHTLTTLLLLPVPRGTLYLGKLVSAAVVLAVLAAVAAVATLVLTGLDLSVVPALAPVLLLAVVGLAAAGVLLAVLAAGTRAREVLLPVLLLPVVLPLLLAGIPATTTVLMGYGVGAVTRELTLLAGYDLAVAAVSYLLFEFAVEG